LNQRKSKTQKKSISTSEIQEILPKQSSPAKAQINIQSQHIQTIFAPEVVTKYGELIPDAPARILSVFEKNSESEREQRKQQLDISSQANDYMAADNRRRDWMAFILIMMAFCASGFFAWLEKIWLSAGVLALIIGWVVKGFLLKPTNSNAKK
jgi:uncharacterized membrane protein